MSEEGEEVSFLTRHNAGGPSLCQAKVRSTDLTFKCSWFSPVEVSLKRAGRVLVPAGHSHHKSIRPHLVSRLAGHGHAVGSQDPGAGTQRYLSWYKLGRMSSRAMSVPGYAALLISQMCFKLCLGIRTGLAAGPLTRLLACQRDWAGAECSTNS